MLNLQEFPTLALNFNQIMMAWLQISNMVWVNFLIWTILAPNKLRLVLLAHKIAHKFINSSQILHTWTLTPVPGESCVSQVSRVFPVTPVYPSYCRVSHYCGYTNILDGGLLTLIISYKNTEMESKVYRVSHKKIYTLSLVNFHLLRQWI